VAVSTELESAKDVNNRCYMCYVATLIIPDWTTFPLATRIH
jgi:hypothetical protein